MSSLRRNVYLLRAHQIASGFHKANESDVSCGVDDDAEGMDSSIFRDASPSTPSPLLALLPSSDPVLERSDITSAHDNHHPSLVSEEPRISGRRVRSRDELDVVATGSNNAPDTINEDEIVEACRTADSWLSHAPSRLAPGTWLDDTTIHRLLTIFTAAVSDSMPSIPFTSPVIPKSLCQSQLFRNMEPLSSFPFTYAPKLIGFSPSFIRTAKSLTCTIPYLAKLILLRLVK